MRSTISLKDGNEYLMLGKKENKLIQCSYYPVYKIATTFIFDK